MAPPITLEKIREFRQLLINASKAGCFIDNDAKDKLNALLLNTMGQVFITVFDFAKYEFTELFKVEKYLGYSDREFTIRTLNNDPLETIHITHPDDIEHTIRYNTIIYKLLSDPPAGHCFELLEDNYEIVFRIRHKDGRFIRIRRKCYLMSLQNGFPEKHIDTWEILNNDFSTHVTTRFQTRTHQLNEAITAMFFRLNCDSVAFWLTPRECEIVKLKVIGKLDKEVADTLGISSRTVEKRVADLRSRANDYLEKRRVKGYVGTTYELIQFLLSYGLYPIPESCQG